MELLGLGLRPVVAFVQIGLYRYRNPIRFCRLRERRNDRQYNQQTKPYERVSRPPKRNPSDRRTEQRKDER